MDGIQRRATPALTPLRHDVLKRLEHRGRIIDRDLTWTERELVSAGLVEVQHRNFGRRLLTITEAGRAALGY